jgi:hypothetical protein
MFPLRTMPYYSFTYNLSTFFVLYFIRLTLPIVIIGYHFLALVRFLRIRSFHYFLRLVRSVTVIICTDPDPDPSVYKQKNYEKFISTVLGLLSYLLS